MDEEKPKAVLGYFNIIARKYDFMNSCLSFGLHHLWKRTAVRISGLKQGDRVLDLCGGTADLAILAARAAGSAGRVLVYDFSLGMMQAGKPKIEKTSLSSVIKCVCGDAGRIAARDNIFDAVLIGFGLRNLAEMGQSLDEMYRVLRPGGKLVCLEFSRPAFPLFRWLYDIYSFYVIPLAGKLITGSREAYTYLPRSIRSFPLPEDLSSIIGEAGFSDVAFKRLTNGVAVIHIGTKSVG